MYLNDKEFEEVIRRYKDQSASGLSFVPDLARMLNYNDCKDLSSDLQSGGHTWERHKAVENLANRLPSERGLYMFVWTPPLEFLFANESPSPKLTWVLYVGKAGVENGTRDTFKDRYQSDYKGKVGTDPKKLWDKIDECRLRDQRLAKYLTLRPLEYWYLPIRDLGYLTKLETRLLKLLNPPLNTQHVVRKLHPVKTSPAF